MLRKTRSTRKRPRSSTRADSLIYEMEKQLRENDDKLSEEDKATVQSELDEFKKVKETNDVEQIKAAIEPLTQKVYQIFGKLYQQENAQAAPDDTEQEAQDAPVENDDGTVNTDFDVE